MESKILIAAAYGQSEVLTFTTTELPTLAPGLARIKVKAAGINPIDTKRMMGEYRQAPLPQAFGTEFAGTIVALGAAPATWAIGDEVLGSGGAFTHATVIDVPLANLIARPASITWPVAGTLAGVAQTAMTILEVIGHVDSLLVHGGSGGVGSITIQLAKEKGIRVVATASAQNLDYLRSLGAVAIAYGPGLAERLQAVHPAPFDAAIDMSGTEAATGVSLQTVKPTGFIGTTVAKTGSSPRVQAIFSIRNPQNLQYVVDGLAAGKFSWKIDKAVAFEKAAEAYARVLGGHTTGKAVLLFND